MDRSSLVTQPTAQGHNKGQGHGRSTPPSDVTDHHHQSSVGLSSGTVIEVTGLILYATQAVSTRLKILYDKLMSGVPQEQLANAMAAFGWSYQEFANGYKTQVGRL